MLELRPTCENCNKALPPESTDAMICTFECTFCRSCVESVLNNVCANCGGGFPRARAAGKQLEGRQLHRRVSAQHEGEAPAVDPRAHAEFAARIKDIPPEKR
jgi:hypothetical protein